MKRIVEHPTYIYTRDGKLIHILNSLPRLVQPNLYPIFLPLNILLTVGDGGPLVSLLLLLVAVLLDDPLLLDLGREGRLAVERRLELRESR